MRDFGRLLVLFIVATLAMAGAWGAGFAVANRIDIPPGIDVTRLQALADRVAPRESQIGSGAAGADDSAQTSAVSGDEAALAAAGTSAEGGHHFDRFWQGWDVIRTAYEGELPDDTEITYGAIRGSLRALEDPYTLFTDPVNTEVQRPDLEGEFQGIGAYVTSNEEGLLVIQTPMRGQPAEKAGLLAGDIVIEVDGDDITDLDVNEAVLLIRGPKGTIVELTIVRDGRSEPFVVAVERDRIEVPSVAEVRMLEEEGAPQVGYIQLTVFAAETRQELVEAIQELRDLGAEALVLDLRNNPGGFLSAAVGVSSEFLSAGDVTIREDSQGSRKKERVQGGGTALDLPLVVMVNGGSASASEIVAGAIRDYERGLIVGETTFGKGSVQNVHELTDGSQLRVTVEIWRTPNGSLIHRQGIEPDIVVTPLPPEEEPDDGDDAEDTDGAPEGDNGTVDGAEPDAAAADAEADEGDEASGDGTGEDDAGASDAEAESPPAPPDVQLERAVEEALRMLGGGA
jgi:carboxyl-terminal processing protease